MNCINHSLLDIFKIGPGPSSSHTIGPMLAANDFQSNLNDAVKIEVNFFGSLALTGKGHGSDRAVIAGLRGEMPESCDTDRLNSIVLTAQESYKIKVNHENVTVQFIFNKGKNNHPYQNTIVFVAYNEEKEVVSEETYYSIGGGFIQKKSMPSVDNSDFMPPYRYKNMDTFRKMLLKNDIDQVTALLENEKAINPEKNVRKELAQRIEVMCSAVERGLNTTGKLPGSLRLSRRAANIFEKAQESCQTNQMGQHILLVDAFACAASEENAAGTLVVTAPTSGASGLIPSIIYYLLNYQKIPLEKVIDGLLIAGCIGAITRRNASISGAEVGCQGEVGVASSMAAALLAQIYTGDIQTIEVAAEIALEHHLGLTCDPIGGYVQIPCIERNAVGAVTAWNAFFLAQVTSGSSSSNMVSFDEVIAAMLQTGQAMSCAFKETSQGGLAKCACCI